MAVNRYQLALLQSYPDVDLLPIDANDPESVDAQITSGDDVGDGLFRFLWRELATDEGVECREEAGQRIENAIKQLNEVNAAIDDLQDEPEPAFG